MNELKLDHDGESEATADIAPTTRLIDPELNNLETIPDLKSLLSETRHLKSLLRVTLALLLLLTVGIAISVSLSTGGHQTAPLKVNVLRRPCGDTPDAARAAGCVFDIVSFCFLHPRCHDFELAAEFAAVEPWQWFRERSNESDTIPREQVLAGQFNVSFVEYRYHIEHCLFMWRKLHRVVLSGRGKESIDSYVGSLEHTHHCGKMFEKAGRTALDAVNTRIRVKYPDCGIE